jgi:hypothetical protein
MNFIPLVFGLLMVYSNSVRAEQLTPTATNAAPVISQTVATSDAQLQIVSLPEMVTTAQRSPDQVSKSVISAGQLRSIAGTGGDILGGLQTLPGVVSSNNGSEPAIRGSGPQENAYYVDDLPVGKIFHFGGISVFNADLVSDFNLYSAAFAPRYANVTGAVIDVALREPRTDRLGSKININLLGADALVEGPVSQDQSFYFAARRSYIDLLIKQVESKGITVQIPNYSDYQGKYKWQLGDSNKLTLETQGASDTLKINVGSSSTLAKQDPILAGNIGLSDRYHMQAATLNSVIFEQAVNTFSVEHIHFDFTNSVASAGKIYVAQADWMLHELLSFPLNQSHELALGANLNQANVEVNADLKNVTCTQFNPDCSVTNAPREKLNESFISRGTDVSAQDRFRVTQRITWVSGVRYSYEDYLRKTYIEPRLGLEWQYTPKTLYTAGWGRHNQMPTGQEIARTFGNPNLAHIRADHSVVGLTHKLDPLWSWKMESYYKKFSQLIVDDPVLNYINAGSGKAYGLELLIKKENFEKISGWLSVSLARSSRRNDVTGESFRYALDQPVNATLVGDWKLNDGWSISGKWHIHSGTPYTPINGTNGTYADQRPKPNYGAINSATLPAYHQLDVRFQKEKLLGRGNKMKYYFEVNNVYQRKNVVGYTYDPTYTMKDPVYPFVLPLSFGVQIEY